MAIINGTAGDDDLVGTEENDTLNGDAGNDTLFSEEGNNSLNGGAGNDILYVGYKGDSLDGGVGEDSLSLDLYYGQTAGFRFDGSASTHLRLADGTTARNGEVFYVFGGSGNDTLIGAAGNDELYGGKGNDTINGGAGNDILNGLQRQEISFGGGGNDNLNGGAGNDTLDGDAGDTLDGGAGKDYLGLFLSTQTAGFRFDASASTHLRLADGTTARNGEVFYVFGGSGNDTLIGAAGNGTLDGGEGEDYFYLDLSSQTAGFRFDGSLGTHLTLADGTTASNGDVFSVIGGSGNDTLIGAAGNDNLSGSNGNDSLLGRDGNDTLSGSDGNDSLLGGDGNDILVGGAGNDLLVGGGGRDQFLYSTCEAFTRAAFGIDVIQSFSHNYDIIGLSKTTFTTVSSAEGTGFSSANEFAVVGSNAAAATSTADIVYNLMNGNLFYNPNGSGAGFGSGGQFATLAENRVLSATDFIIQA